MGQNPKPPRSVGCCVLVLGMLLLWFFGNELFNVAVNSWLTLTDRHSSVHYAGDGTFGDAGPTAGHNRFQVDLGDLRLGQNQSQRFVLQGLPNVKLTPFVLVNTPLLINKEEQQQLSWVDTIVSLHMTDGETTVFDIEKPLSDWTWSGLIGGPSTCLYVLETSFAADPRKRYELTVKVSGEIETAPVSRLVLRGGGWQVD